MNKQFEAGTWLINPTFLDLVLVHGYATDGRIITESEDGTIEADCCDWTGWQIAYGCTGFDWEPSKANVPQIERIEIQPCPYIAAALTGLLANPNVVVHNHLTGWSACNTDWAGVVDVAREIGKIASEGK